MFAYFTILWDILRPIGILFGHLVKFVVIWYIFHVLACFTQINLAILLWTEQLLSLNRIGTFHRFAKSGHPAPV
jgi:hypothetical protein